MDIRYVAVAEQLVQFGLDGTIRNIPLRDESSTARIGVEGEAVREHVRREPAVFRISAAFALMNEYWAGKRELFHFVERIISEEDAAVLTKRKSFEAMPTWSVTGCELDM